jgi:hypothetical protein
MSTLHTRLASPYRHSSTSTQILWYQTVVGEYEGFRAVLISHRSLCCAQAAASWNAVQCSHSPGLQHRWTEVLAGQNVPCFPATPAGAFPSTKPLLTASMWLPAGHFHGQDDPKPHIIPPAVRCSQLTQSLHGYTGCLWWPFISCILNSPQPDEGTPRSCALCSHGPPQLPGGCQRHQCCQLQGASTGNGLQRCCQRSALAACRPCSTAGSPMRQTLART